MSTYQLDSTKKDTQESTLEMARSREGNGVGGVECRVVFGDSRVVLSTLEQKADLIVTSPPYADARKKHYESIHPDAFPDWFATFHESFWESLKPKGSLVINIKDKVVDGVRHRYVWKTIERMCELGWCAIDDYVWHKTNPMPGFWKTRLRDGWEYCFHLAKTTAPYVNQDAVKVPLGAWAEARLAKLTGKSAVRHNSENNSGFGRDLRRWVGKKKVLPSNVLSFPLVGRNYNHPAVFPTILPAFFIKLLSPPSGLIVDPFGGSGSTGVAALQLGRDSILIDNDEKYCFNAVKRIRSEAETLWGKVVPVNFRYPGHSGIEPLSQDSRKYLAVHQKGTRHTN